MQRAADAAWRGGARAALQLLMSAAGSAPGGLAAAQDAQAPSLLASEIEANGYVDGIALEEPAPALRLEGALGGEVVVIVGVRRREEFASRVEARRERRRQDRCSHAVQTRIEGDPLRAHMESAVDICARTEPR